MTPDELNAIGRILDSVGTLTLATCDSSVPWATSLFFARDVNLNLYFLSGQRTRHVRDLLAIDDVAVTVNADYRAWKHIRGLQIGGTADVVAKATRPEIVALYLDKFTELRKVVSAPAGVFEQQIAKAFEASDFFRIRPKTIRMIDNTMGFGHTSEFILDDTLAPEISEANVSRITADPPD